MDILNQCPHCAPIVSSKGKWLRLFAVIFGFISFTSVMADKTWGKDEFIATIFLAQVGLTLSTVHLTKYKHKRLAPLIAIALSMTGLGVSFAYLGG